MIFAWNPVDPVTGDNDWQYHGSNRIQRTLMLLSYKDESLDQQFNLPSDTFTHSLRMDNVIFFNFHHSQVLYFKVFFSC